MSTELMACKSVLLECQKERDDLKSRCNDLSQFLQELNDTGVFADRIIRDDGKFDNLIRSLHEARAEIEKLEFECTNAQRESEDLRILNNDLQNGATTLSLKSQDYIKTIHEQKDEIDALPRLVFEYICHFDDSAIDPLSINSDLCDFIRWRKNLP